MSVFFVMANKRNKNNNFITSIIIHIGIYATLGFKMVGCLAHSESKSKLLSTYPQSEWAIVGFHCICLTLTVNI